MLFNYNRVYNYQFVSVIIPSATTARIYFPDLPNLRNVYTIGISCYNYITFATDANGFTVNNNPPADANITLVENNIERFQGIDAATINPITGLGQNFANLEGMLSIKPTMFDYSKSYIQMPTGFVATPNTSIPFGIYYLYPHEYKALQQ